MLSLMATQSGVRSAFADALVDHVAPRHDLRFYEPSQALAAQLDGVRVVIDALSPHPDGLVDLAPDLALWHAMGTGTDHIDVVGLAARGIAVANCPGSTGAVALAEHSLLLMLALARGYDEATGSVAAGGWGHPFSDELAGRTLTLVGFGSSGQALAVRARALGMHVIAMNRSGTPPPGGGAEVDELVALDSLDSVLARTDVLSLHLPSAPGTDRIIDGRRLGLLRRGALVINVARGRLLDEFALVDALASGRLGGAGLDVFDDEPLPLEHPLRGLPNVILTGHIAGRTRQTGARRAGIIAANCDRLDAGEPLLHVVEPTLPPTRR